MKHFLTSWGCSISTRNFFFPFPKAQKSPKGLWMTQLPHYGLCNHQVMILLKKPTLNQGFPLICHLPAYKKGYLRITKTINVFPQMWNHALKKKQKNKWIRSKVPALKESLHKKKSTTGNNKSMMLFRSGEKTAVCNDFWGCVYVCVTDFPSQIGLYPRLLEAKHWGR